MIRTIITSILLTACNAGYGQVMVITDRPLAITERIVDSEYYVCFFTASYCGPCQQFKNSGKLTEMQKRFAVTVVDIEKSPEWARRVNRIPAFWLARRSDQTRVKAWTGVTSIEIIETEVLRIRSAKRALRTPSLFGRFGTSHESRETLIHHLLYEGIHRGRWTLHALTAMSDSALDTAHNRDHGRN